MGPLPTGNSYIVTLKDYFSKWTEKEPLKDKSAQWCGFFLVQNDLQVMFLDKGLQFSFLLTDMALLIASSVIKGGSFFNLLNEELFHLTKIHHKISSAYHPQALWKGITKLYNDHC